MTVRTLLYLRSANLSDRLFMRDLFANAPALSEPLLVVHDGPAQPEQAAFVGRRVSANLSEAMVANAAFGAHQRNMVVQTSQGLFVDTQKIDSHFATLACIVLSPSVAVPGSGEQAVAGDELFRALRAAYPTARVVLCPDNPLSPVGANAQLVNADNEQKLLEAYPEEAIVLGLAAEAAGSWVVSPNGFAKLKTMV